MFSLSSPRTRGGMAPTSPPSCRGAQNEPGFPNPSPGLPPFGCPKPPKAAPRGRDEGLLMGASSPLLLNAPAAFWGAVSRGGSPSQPSLSSPCSGRSICSRKGQACLCPGSACSQPELRSSGAAARLEFSSNSAGLLERARLPRFLLLLLLRLSSPPVPPSFFPGRMAPRVPSPGSSTGASPKPPQKKPLTLRVREGQGTKQVAPFARASPGGVRRRLLCSFSPCLVALCAHPHPKLVQGSPRAVQSHPAAFGEHGEPRLEARAGSCRGRTGFSVCCANHQKGSLPGG